MYVSSTSVDFHFPLVLGNSSSGFSFYGSKPMMMICRGLSGTYIWCSLMRCIRVRYPGFRIRWETIPRSGRTWFPRIGNGALTCVMRACIAAGSPAGSNSRTPPSPQYTAEQPHRGVQSVPLELSHGPVSSQPYPSLAFLQHFG